MNQFGYRSLLGASMRMRKQGQAWMFQRVHCQAFERQSGQYFGELSTVFRKTGQKIQKYEHFNLFTDNLLSLNAF